MRADKRIKDLQRRFPAWTVTITSGGHIRLTHRRSGKTLFASRTPSDWRSDRNLASQVRRAERGGNTMKYESVGPGHVIG